MYLASAYPDSAISAGKMTLIAIVMVASLIAWLIPVFLADRQGSRKEARQADVPTPVAAVPGPAAEDEHTKAVRAPVDDRHGAAA
jgi:hypothetical protein